MSIDEYFTEDDGSLPEIEISFREPAQVSDAFSLLFSLGAKDVSAGGARVWLPSTDADREFAGPSDAELVIAGQLHPFHVVLGGLRVGDVVLPDLGVWLDANGLTLDYRMGQEWGAEQIDGLVHLLRQLKRLGGTITVPWWGADGEYEFSLIVGTPN